MLTESEVNEYAAALRSLPNPYHVYRGAYDTYIIARPDKVGFVEASRYRRGWVLSSVGRHENDTEVSMVSNAKSLVHAIVKACEILESHDISDTPSCNYKRIIKIMINPNEAQSQSYAK